MTTRSDDAELTCPRCGYVLEDGVELSAREIDTELRVPAECPACAAPLEVIARPTVGTGAAAWVEDHRAENDRPDA